MSSRTRAVAYVAGHIVLLDVGVDPDLTVVSVDALAGDEEAVIVVAFAARKGGGRKPGVSRAGQSSADVRRA